MTQVVIDDIIPRTQLLATAGQTVFNTNWTSDVGTDVDVYARAVGVPPDDITQLVSPTLYNVTFIGGSQTVRVTFLSGRVLNDVITIVRNTPAERLNLYINTNFVPSMLNQDFGILTLVDQQAQMYDTVVNPGYNVSATIEPIVDEILPILEANQVWAMNPTRTAIIGYDVPASGGIAPKTANYLIQTATSELPNAQAMGSLASGIVINTVGTGVQLTRILIGIADQTSITNADGISGNPTVGIAANPILPGTEYFIPPTGTTAQRPGSPVHGMVRFNSTIGTLEVYEGSAWDPLSGGVVDLVSGTANQIGVDNSDQANPIVYIVDNPVIPGVAGITLPLGTTAQRGGALGTIRFNSQTSEFEGTTDGAIWNTFQTSAGTILSVSGTLNRISVTAGVNPVVDIDAAYVGQSSITTLGTITTGVWNGTIVGVTYGGTGVSSVTTSPTATAFAGWDANSNLSSSAYIVGFVSQATAAGTTTLTVASKQIQEFTGTLTETVAMPVASTLVAGMYFDIINNSSGALTVNSSGGNLILTMAANTTARITCVLNSGTNAASWNSSYVFDLGAGVISLTGTPNQVIFSASTGNVTASLPQSIATTSDVTFGSVAFSPNTKGIVGTPTNDSAVAGYVGELISSVTSPGTPLTSTVSVNGTSISLTAGDWYVWGSCYFSGLSMTILTTAISQTSATLPDIGLTGSIGGTSLQSSNILALPKRVSLSGTTTIYIVANGTFTGACSLNRANIYARRVR